MVLELASSSDLKRTIIKESPPGKLAGLFLLPKMLFDESTA